MNLRRPRGSTFRRKDRTGFPAAWIGASWGVLFCVFAVFAREADCSSILGLQTQVQQEFYEPLIPLTKNFKTCFKTDAKGSQVLSICTETVPAAPATDAPLDSQRLPASTPAQVPAPVPVASPRAMQKSQAPQGAAPAVRPAVAAPVARPIAPASVARPSSAQPARVPSASAPASPPAAARSVPRASAPVPARPPSK